MFAISLIHRTGGSFTCTGNTLEECRASASKQCEAYPNSYVAATITYKVYRENACGLCPYDVSVPFDIRKWLGLELRLTLLDDEG
jgi:hypothetical protein